MQQFGRYPSKYQCECHLFKGGAVSIIVDG